MHAPSPQTIPPEMLLLAYRSGIFPMADTRDDPDIFWVEPRERAIIPLDGFHCARTLRKVLRQDRFTVTCDTAFTEVIDACAAPRDDHPESWISERIAASYSALHRAGHAHSIECWQDGELAGGLYGVSFERAFCGESMFSRANDASKVALAWLIAMMRQAGFMLLDCQFMTGHLSTLGAVTMPQADYLTLLSEACEQPSSSSLPDAYRALIAQAGDHSPGKLIAQSFTQTS
ncbi:leucyl/phenylalanyl-tRNA--protein transferase [Altericroceibacterium endophyticum]|uniref:Leucyl/phenylalanyl-tRNA--protein transferase n=1 Tax=Altericroceibacterium endophyticum TaxID=1808508 RepID=A0A6I4T4W4_9SPHN|nr:leucyl/phenylalanyl-tRNA--protein transferase [Altericroceibacterium endophyticum]MXO65262.1 leucyl/phenylalanyl-tRNA--protein transferase [Altericroceibacterium endophyticum]